MIVYVESNFVLELAFLRDDCVSCKELIGLAKEKSIELAIPAYSFAEPYDTLVRREKKRKQLHGTLTDELKELSRSEPFVESAEELGKMTSLLINANDQEDEQLTSVIQELVEVATIISMDKEIIKDALNIQNYLGLSPQDSIVYASVRSMIVKNKTPQCFANKNTKDFLTPDIQSELASHQCKLFGNFENALGFVKHSIKNNHDLLGI